jgi:aryl-alcohol dehydrogenase-like predicted oxidoreductase
LELRNIGRSGLRASVIGIGASNFGGRIADDVASRIIDTAVDLGVNFVDTADVYGGRGGSEDALGRFLGARRKDVVLASKFGSAMDDLPWNKGNSRRVIMAAIEGSLRRLRTDWVDLYYVHWPDVLTPIEETLRATGDLVRQGKVRYVAHSNFSVKQTLDAAYVAKVYGLSPCIASQCEYSLLARQVERELIPACLDCGVGFIPYQPLANGMLAGRYKRGEAPATGSRLAQVPRWAAQFLTDANFAVVERIEKFCADRGYAIADVALNWLLAKPGVASVIAGVSTPEQLQMNVAALKMRLSPDDVAELDRISARP